jgi:serine protease Do
VVNIATTEKAPPQMQQRMPNFPPGSPFEEFFKQFFDQQQRGPRHALGSGFLISSDGYIVTNNHVVKGATKIEVTMSDGTTYPAEVKGTDPKTDVALLKIDAKKELPHVVFGDSEKARIGDWVVAVGNPFGLGGSVTAGIISASGREINAGPYDNFLQIDAPINPGNSGGPVFNQRGEVIGISSAIYTPSGGNVGIGFAIPSKLASHIVEQLKSSGKVERGWLGVQMQPMTDTLAKAVGRPNDKGVIVSMVTPDSPAERGGVKQGDVIIGINGDTIEQPRDLALAVADLKAGDKAKLQVWRNGKEQTLNVTIGSQPADQTASAGEESSDDKVGLALAPLTPELRGQLGLESQVSGVVVADVVSGSRAEESGVHQGDVIVQVAGEKVSSPDQVASKIRSARRAKKEAVTLLVLRGGTTYYLALPLA